MATIKAIIRRDKEKKNGQVPIYIRMTINRKHKYISLRQSIFEKDWNADRQRVRKSHPNHRILNQLIVDKLAEVESLALESEINQRGIGQKNLRSALEQGSDYDVIEFAESVHQSLHIQGRFGTLHGYKIDLNCFRRFLKTKRAKDKLPFNELTKALLLEYRTYLEVEIGNAKTTIRHKLGHLKMLVNRAIESGIVGNDFNPFKGVRLERSKQKRIIPSAEDVELLRNFDLRTNTFGWHARNMYLFAATMAGLRFSDVLRLRWMDLKEGRLHWQTQKTQEQKALYVPEEAMNILNHYRGVNEKPTDYIFPLLREQEFDTAEQLHAYGLVCNNRVNRSLRSIWKRAGASRYYSFHTSRHFFATDSLRKGMRVEILKEIMTHSSIDQTLAYARIANEQMDEAMKAYEMARQY